MNKKQFAVALLGLFVFTLGGCTKNSKNITYNDSGIEYIYSPSPDPLIAAQLNGEPVTVEQLLSQSPALEDLSRAEAELLMGMLYQQLLEKYKLPLSENKPVAAKVRLQNLSEKLEAIVKSFGLELNPLIEVSFVEPKLQLPTLASSEIAVVNETPLRIANLNLNHLRYQVIKKQQFQEMLARLQGLLVRRLLLEASKKTGQSIEDYISAKITTSPISVPKAEFDKFVTKNNFSPTDLTPELVTKINSILSEKEKTKLVETFVASKLLSGPVSIHFQNDDLGFKINPDMAVVWGYKTAPIQIALFSEMLCSQCVSLGQDLIKLRAEFDGQLKISLNHFFGDSDRNSRMLAEAAMCASSQNPKLFGKFFDAYVTQKPGLDESVIYQTASNIGANVEELKSCFMSRTHKDLVDSHLRYAKSINVMSLPTLLIDDEVLEGEIQYDSLKKLIEKKIQQKGDPWYRAMYRRWFAKD